MRNTIIGIAGGSGSGKTTLAKSIIDRFGDGYIYSYSDIGSRWGKHSDNKYGAGSNRNTDLVRKAKGIGDADHYENRELLHICRIGQ